MRLSDIAEKLSALEGREADEIHIRLRNPLMKALLSGSDGRTRNSPSEYGERELFRARILLALFDCRLSTAELAQVNHKLNSAVENIPIERSYYPMALDSIIRGAKEGQRWLLRVRFTRTADGQQRISPWVHPESVADVQGRAPAALDLYYDETHIGTLSIPASDLLLPLLES